jgi:hypothetical protein
MERQRHQQSHQHLVSQRSWGIWAICLCRMRSLCTQWTSWITSSQSLCQILGKTFKASFRSRLSAGKEVSIKVGDEKKVRNPLLNCDCVAELCNVNSIMIQASITVTVKNGFFKPAQTHSFYGNLCCPEVLRLPLQNTFRPSKVRATAFKLATGETIAFKPATGQTTVLDSCSPSTCFSIFFHISSKPCPKLPYLSSLPPSHFPPYNKQLMQVGGCRVVQIANLVNCRLPEMAKSRWIARRSSNSRIAPNLWRHQLCSGNCCSIEFSEPFAVDIGLNPEIFFLFLYK